MAKEKLELSLDFTLPVGYEVQGTLHREGSMRMATAADEIAPWQDPRVKGNPEYVMIIVLARVVTRLGSLDRVNTDTIEKLFVKDYEYLLGLYNRLNENGFDAIEAACECGKKFFVEVPKPGESPATP